MPILLLFTALSASAAEWPAELRGVYFGFAVREANRASTPFNVQFSLRIGANEMRLLFPPDAEGRRWSLPYDVDEFQKIDDCFFAEQARPPLRVCFAGGLRALLGQPSVTVTFGPHRYDSAIARLFKKNRWNEFRARALHARMNEPENEQWYRLEKLDANRLELALQTRAIDEVEKLLGAATQGLEFRTPQDTATATRIFHAALLNWRDEHLALRGLAAIQQKPRAFALGVLADFIEKLGTGYSTRVMSAALDAAAALLNEARIIGEARAKLFARYRYDGLDGGVYTDHDGEVLRDDRDSVLALMLSRGQSWSAYERLRLLNAAKLVPRQPAVPADIAAKFLTLYNREVDRSPSSLRTLCEAAIGG